MNKRQLEVEKAKLADEKKVLDALRKQYEQAAADVQGKINIHTNKINIMLNEWDDIDEAQQSIIQSQIYQRKFQQQLKAQLDDIIDKMDSGMFETVQEYLDKCYLTGLIGTAYDLHGQGIPVVSPIDQKAMLNAVTLDPKLSEKLYGDYMGEMKQAIRGEISRGIATADSFTNIARNISNKTNVGLNKTMRIVRTEGHRIQIEGAVEMQDKAKKAGADVLKQWDATLDGKTRESHRRVDGELRELDEKFSNGLMHPSDSSGGAAEVVNCRCALLQRARWALDDDELETLKQRAAYFGLDKADNFNDFQKKFAKGAEAVKKMPVGFVPAKTIEEAEEYAKRFVVEKTWSGDGNISYKGLSIESANKLNETLTGLFESNDIPLLYNIQPMNFRAKLWKGSENVPMAYRSMHSGELYFNPKIMKNAKTLEAYMQEGKKAYKICGENIEKFTGRNREIIETYLKAGRSLIAEDVDDTMKAIIEHEIGHHIQNNIIYRSEDMAKIVAEGYEKYAVKISGYATKTYGEYIAESFAAYCNGKSDIIDPELKKIFKDIQSGKKTKAVASYGKSGIMQATNEFIKIIPDAKLVDYALNPLKDENKAKAFELALGYTKDNYQDLKKQVIELVDERKLVPKGDIGYGMRYEYVIEVNGLNGKKAKVLTAWIEDGEDKRLTSIYVTDKDVTK